MGYGSPVANERAASANGRATQRVTWVRPRKSPLCDALLNGKIFSALLEAGLLIEQ
jgi:hypothetical protein